MNKNAFALCKTQAEMEFHWQIMTSPENISCDGELPIAAQKARIRQLTKDYKERFRALSLEHS